MDAVWHECLDAIACGARAARTAACSSSGGAEHFADGCSCGAPTAPLVAPLPWAEPSAPRAPLPPQVLECAHKFKSQQKAQVLSGVKGDEQYKARRPGPSGGAADAVQPCLDAHHARLPPAGSLPAYLPTCLPGLPDSAAAARLPADSMPAVPLPPPPCAARRLRHGRLLRQLLQCVPPCSFARREGGRERGGRGGRDDARAACHLLRAAAAGSRDQSVESRCCTRQASCLPALPEASFCPPLLAFRLRCAMARPRRATHPHARPATSRPPMPHSLPRRTRSLPGVAQRRVCPPVAQGRADPAAHRSRGARRQGVTGRRAPPHGGGSGGGGGGGARQPHAPRRPGPPTRHAWIEYAHACPALLPCPGSCLPLHAGLSAVWCTLSQAHASRRRRPPATSSSGGQVGERCRAPAAAFPQPRPNRGGLTRAMRRLERRAARRAEFGCRGSSKPPAETCSALLATFRRPSRPSQVRMRAHMPQLSLGCARWSTPARALSVARRPRVGSGRLQLA